MTAVGWFDVIACVVSLASSHGMVARIPWRCRATSRKVEGSRSMYNVLTPPLSSFCRSCSSKNWVKYEGALEISAVKHSIVSGEAANHQMRSTRPRGGRDQIQFGWERPSRAAESKADWPTEHGILCSTCSATAMRPMGG